MQDLWVFGYGSLMWRPGFPFVERYAARLHGYHRSFCVFSHVHRGTREKPGLVFGLDRGGSCRGFAYQVAADDAEATRTYLQEREQVTSVYLDVTRSLTLIDGPSPKVEALCFIVDRQHEQYAGKLAFDRQVDLITHGQGQSGKNPEYLQSTVDHLREMNISDHGLEVLWHAVEQRLCPPSPHR
jgi:glutathione-specific gamma-glutamylcyclotransferase